MVYNIYIYIYSFLVFSSLEKPLLKYKNISNEFKKTGNIPFNELLMIAQTQKQRIEELEQKVAELNEDKKSFTEKLEISIIKKEKHKKRAIEIQRKLDVYIENSTYIKNNLTKYNEEAYKYRIEHLEQAMENMSGVLFEKENDLKVLLAEKKKDLGKNILLKIEDIGFYDIKLINYLKYKSFMIDNAVSYIYIYIYGR